MRKTYNLKILFLCKKQLIIQICYCYNTDNCQLMQKISSQFSDLKYIKGFGNSFESQAKEGAIPQNQNSPIKLKYGLYAEQLSGTAFTMKRAQSQKSWLYKIRPTVIQGQYQPAQYKYRIVDSFIKNDGEIDITPNQTRWKPLPECGETKRNFVEGMTSLMGSGEPSMKQGIAIYAYSANQSMGKTAFYNSDGDFLIVPHKGTLYIKTLMGKLTVQPLQICIIPRGVNFTVDVQGEISGWICQNFGHHYSLPQLGPIGANGLANPKDFCYPTAWFEDEQAEWKLINKYIGKMFQAKTNYSPYDVVGWRGNYAPCKYDLKLYNTIGSISFDHPDPSIFTVLTSKSHIEGMASLDFVIFPPRWLVAEHTFKPPYYHRNCMSQFMGNIVGQYDAKGQGFAPGCSSLHSCMTGHGPDAQTYEKFVNSQNNEKPHKTNDQSFAFMFESGFLLKTTKYARNQFLHVDQKYSECWQKLKDIKFEAQK